MTRFAPVAWRELVQRLRELGREQMERGRINVFKQVGARYLKVTYKEYLNELLIISAVDKSD